MRKLKYIQLVSALALLGFIILFVVSTYIQLKCGYDCRLFQNSDGMAVVGYQFLALFLGIPSLIVLVFASIKLRNEASKQTAD